MPLSEHPAPSAHSRALALLHQLWLGGVRDVVLAPGSRSSALALALDAADRAGDLRLHVRVDERSAAFLALGLATGSRRPVPVVTTSGTAVGNLLPAVMEAHHTGRQLIVISADRPDHLRGTGANQTTQQAGIFGTFAPCHDLTVDALSDSIAEAVTAALTAVGPTHINVQFDGNLLPPPSLPRNTRFEVESTGAPVRSTTNRPFDAVRPDPAGAERARPTVLPLGPRTVVVAGDDAGPAARLLAQNANWPLLAEPTSGARIGTHAIRTYRLLLGTALRDEVERVVVIGHPTLSRPITDLISDDTLEVLAVRDRTGTATNPGRVARVLDAVPTVAGADEPEWLDRWRSADAALSQAIDESVAPQGLSPLAAAAIVGRAVVDHATLVVGSSNPIRDLDIMATPWPPHQHRFVVGNRGLAGIDGVVSTAIGVALGRPDASRTIAYLGDLTFLHDTNGLLIGPNEPRPDLTLVVLNDDGGAIFSTLEQGAPDYAEAFERVFGTPHGTDVAALCAAHGIPHELVTTPERLAAALESEPSGIRLLEVRVPRTDRRAEAERLRAMARDVAEPMGRRD